MRDCSPISEGYIVLKSIASLKGMSYIAGAWGFLYMFLSEIYPVLVALVDSFGDYGLILGDFCFRGVG